ncbi:MAG TPA: polyphosphate kinase 1, partial [Balneolales bacterium]|nr:polyphosphate kinase 1 [Balneolales bacterium]
HSFATSVQRFVEEAAEDPKVLAIKQTLYRTSSDSPLMHALMKAADMGKQVAMLVELKARFDEERNIEWGQKLEKAGAHVAYGLPGLKIHSKLTIVVREEDNGELRSYVHLSSGNYHPKTAQLYEDLGLFTCDPVIASDVTDLFNFLTGYAPEQNYQKLIVAPNYMRDKMAKLIEQEIYESKRDRPARIIAKMNSLEDPLIIQKLYEASQAGVKIDIIVRGVCRLIPQKKGLSENIRIHSIIGRFLEHSRIYYFHHGGKDLYFTGSADWMHRNLDARVESLVPIEQPSLKKYLQFVLNIYLNDNSQRWILNADGSYTKLYPGKDEKEVRTHDVLMEHTLKTKDPIPKTV